MNYIFVLRGDNVKDLSNKNVIHVKDNDIEYLQFKKLLEYKEIINHAYPLGLDVGFKTTKPDQKPTSPERMELARKSYQKLCSGMGSNDTHIVQANENHTDIVKIVQTKVNVDEPDFSLTEEGIEDGLITNQRNLALATTNADCILLLFFDPVKRVIANTHSGWKGTLQRISIKTVYKMMKEFGSNPQDIICCICPSIRKCHFEVDKDVKDMFQNEFYDLENAKFIDIEEGNRQKVIRLRDFIEEKVENTKWNIDTVLINKILLQEEGLKPENIIDSGICSVCHSDIIHSYRIEKKDYNTETAVIELK